MVALPRLCAICDADASARAGWPLLDFARAFLNGGARLLQVRAKSGSSGWLLETSIAIVAAAREANATVIINDRADVARLAGANGVHVGQHDLPPAAVRPIVGEASIIGLSTHTPDEFTNALSEPIDYVAIGPVFETSTKATGHEAVGLARVAAGAAATRRLGLPLVAIGGITLDRAPGVLRAGADSVAVIGDLLAGGHPEARVAAYVAALERESR
jgi:thiamine-phosphate pyrophosphorylase